MVSERAITIYMVLNRSVVSVKLLVCLFSRIGSTLLERESKVVVIENAENVNVRSRTKKMKLVSSYQRFTTENRIFRSLSNEKYECKC